MRAFWRVLLAPLIIAAAAVSSATAPHAAAPAHSVAFASTTCPEGTNWDNILHMCD